MDGDVGSSPLASSICDQAQADVRERAPDVATARAGSSRRPRLLRQTDRRHECCRLRWTPAVVLDDRSHLGPDWDHRALVVGSTMLPTLGARPDLTLTSTPPVRYRAQECDYHRDPRRMYYQESRL